MLFSHHHVTPLEQQEDSTEWSGTTQTQVTTTSKLFDVVWNRVNRFPLLINEPAEATDAAMIVEQPQYNVDFNIIASMNTMSGTILSSSGQQEPSYPVETCPKLQSALDVKGNPHATQPKLPILQFAVQVAWALYCSTTTTTIHCSGKKRPLQLLLPSNEDRQPSRITCRDGKHLAPTDTAVVTATIDYRDCHVKKNNFHMDNSPKVLKDDIQERQAFAQPLRSRNTFQLVISPNDKAFNESTVPEEKTKSVIIEKQEQAAKFFVDKPPNNKDTSEVASEENDRLAPVQCVHRDDDSDDSYWRTSFQYDDEFELADDKADYNNFQTQTLCNISDEFRDDDASPVKDSYSETYAVGSNANVIELKANENLPFPKKSRVSFHKSTREASSSPEQFQNDTSENIIGEASTSKKRKSKDKERKEKKKKKRHKKSRADTEIQKEQGNHATNPASSNNSVPAQTAKPDTPRGVPTATKGSSDVRDFMKLWKKRDAELHSQNSKDIRLHAQDYVPNIAKKPERLPAGTVTASKKRFQTRKTPSVQTVGKSGVNSHHLSSTVSENNARQLRATFSQDSSIGNSRSRVPRVSLPGRTGPEQNARVPSAAPLSNDYACPRDDSNGNRRQSFPQQQLNNQQELQDHIISSVSNKVTHERLRFEKSYAGETSVNRRCNPTLVTPGTGLRSNMREKARESIPMQNRIRSSLAGDQIQSKRQAVGEIAEMRKGVQATFETQANISSVNQPPNVDGHIFRDVPIYQEEVPQCGRLTALDNGMMRQPHGSWHERESGYSSTAGRDQPRDPFGISSAFVDASHGQNILKVYCAERFVETWPQVVGKLSSGSWENKCEHSLLPNQVFELLDTQLVDQCSVDIELSSKSAILLSPLSLFADRNTCKEAVIDIAALVAIGRYEHLFVIFVLDDNSKSSAQARSAELQLQAATIRQSSVPPTSTHVKTATVSSLPESIAEIIIAANAASDQETNILPEPLGQMVVQRARFLLSMIPTMSLSAAIQSLTVGSEMSGGPGAGFKDIIASERTRQQISLRATAKPSAAANIPAASIIQLSHASRAKISVDSK